MLKEQVSQHRKFKHNFSIDQINVKIRSQGLCVVDDKFPKISANRQFLRRSLRSLVGFSEGWLCFAKVDEVDWVDEGGGD